MISSTKFIFYIFYNCNIMVIIFDYIQFCVHLRPSPEIDQFNSKQLQFKCYLIKYYIKMKPVICSTKFIFYFFDSIQFNDHNI